MDRKIKALDNPIWHALSNAHACFAEGYHLAKRYQTDIGPLAAVREQSLEAYNALAELLGPNDIAVLFLDTPPQLPEGWRFLMNTFMEQMVCITPPPVSALTHSMEDLTTADVPEMMALAKLTEPGPFRQRTIALGGFRGIRESGQLAAMTGQRTHPPGFVEVSAVCTHPNCRKRGYANALVSDVSHRILARNETPFLGALQSNINAISVYEKQGFKIRRTLHLAVVHRPA
ncbi:MAG TPA: GNAT family N-acetyltransferase [Pseudacidobacterium sp.]|jgi:predicted GNAT family acetyltransferase|nr:GNAT family N-acetyltransferase [Pseudacidobacterium sp.]